MAEKPKEVLPFPTTKEEKEAARRLHRERQAQGRRIPYFQKEDGSFHYLDNKKGALHFNDLATKLKNEAARRAKKLNATPLLEDYISVYGEQLGKELFAAENAQLTNLYRSTNSLTHDVDHMHSLKSGGMHHSNNLRAQLASENRSEGARTLTPETKNALMVADDKIDQIKLSGPKLTPDQTKKVFATYEVAGGVTTKLAPKAAKGVVKTAAKFVPVAGSGMVFAEFGQRAATAAAKPTALNLLQATISGLESAAEGVSLASYGSVGAAPIGAIADGVSMSLGLVNGALDAVNNLSGVTPSTPSKRRPRRLP